MKIEEGMKLRATIDFGCIRRGAVVVAAKDEYGEFYVQCSEGRHYLTIEPYKDENGVDKIDGFEFVER